MDGISSNIKDLFERIQRNATEPFLEPFVNSLAQVEKFLKSNEAAIQGFFSGLATGAIATGESLSESLGPVFENVVEAVGELGPIASNVFSLVTDGLKEVAIALGPVLTKLTDVIAFSVKGIASLTELANLRGINDSADALAALARQNGNVTQAAIDQASALKQLKAIKDSDKTAEQIAREKQLTASSRLTIAAIDDQIKVTKAINAVGAENQAAKAQEITNLEKARDALSKNSGAIELQAKQLEKLGTASEQNAKKAANAIASIKNEGGGDLGVFQKNAEELIKVTEAQVQAGEITKAEAEKRLGLIANNTKAEVALQKSAQDAIAKVRKTALDAEITEIDKRRSVVDSALAKGTIGEAEAAKRSGELKRQELQKQIAAEQATIDTAKGVEKAKAIANKAKLQAELDKEDKASADRVNQERLKDFDEQQRVLEARLATGKVSQSQFNKELAKLQEDQSTEELAQLRVKLSKLGATDKEGREAIEAQIAAVESKRAANRKAAYDREVAVIEEALGKQADAIRDKETAAQLAIAQQVAAGTKTKEAAALEGVKITQERTKAELALEVDRYNKLKALPKLDDPKAEADRQDKLRDQYNKTQQLRLSLIKSREEAERASLDAIAKANQDAEEKIKLAQSKRQGLVKTGELEALKRQGADVEAIARDTAAKELAIQRDTLAQEAKAKESQIAKLRQLAASGVMSPRAALEAERKLQSELTAININRIEAEKKALETLRAEKIRQIELDSKASIDPLQRRIDLLSQAKTLIQEQNELTAAQSRLEEANFGLAQQRLKFRQEDAQAAGNEAAAAAIGQQIARENLVNVIRQNQAKVESQRISQQQKQLDLESAALQAQIAQLQASANVQKAIAEGKSQVEVAALQRQVELQGLIVQNTQRAVQNQGVIAQKENQALQAENLAATERAAREVQLSQRGKTKEAEGKDVTDFSKQQSLATIIAQATAQQEQKPVELAPTTIAELKTVPSGPQPLATVQTVSQGVATIQEPKPQPQQAAIAGIPASKPPTQTPPKTPQPVSKPAEKVPAKAVADEADRFTTALTAATQALGGFTSAIASSKPGSAQAIAPRISPVASQPAASPVGLATLATQPGPAALTIAAKPPTGIAEPEQVIDLGPRTVELLNRQGGVLAQQVRDGLIKAPGAIAQQVKAQETTTAKALGAIAPVNQTGIAAPQQVIDLGPRTTALLNRQGGVLAEQIKQGLITVPESTSRISEAVNSIKSQRNETRDLARVIQLQSQEKTLDSAGKPKVAVQREADKTQKGQPKIAIAQDSIKELAAAVKPAEKESLSETKNGLTTTKSDTSGLTVTPATVTKSDGSAAQYGQATVAQSDGSAAQYGQATVTKADTSALQVTQATVTKATSALEVTVDGVTKKLEATPVEEANAGLQNLADSANGYANSLKSAPAPAAVPGFFAGGRPEVGKPMVGAELGPELVAYDSGDYGLLSKPGLYVLDKAGEVIPADKTRAMLNPANAIAPLTTPQILPLPLIDASPASRAINLEGQINRVVSAIGCSLPCDRCQPEPQCSMSQQKRLSQRRLNSMPKLSGCDTRAEVCRSL